ncbi:MAG: hypothetical protein IKJ55_04695 [Clostridia bacterium]|nr:hypothetical protein [Clostridia bacterium]
MLLKSLLCLIILFAFIVIVENRLSAIYGVPAHDPIVTIFSPLLIK